MRKRLPVLSLIVFLLFLTICQHPALARDFAVNQLDAICSKPGDTGSAGFVTDTHAHSFVLQLLGTGSAEVKGAATFRNTKFQTVAVRFEGDSFKDLVPATLIIRIKFIKPGTTQILDHGYNVARNTVRVLPNGVTDVLINSQSFCDCHDQIPPGSALLAVSCDLFCADTDNIIVHKELVHRLVVNDHLIPFDLTAPSAFCASE